MTIQDKQNKIREACIAANPSILDLVFGCKVVWIGNEKEFYFISNGMAGLYTIWNEESSAIHKNPQDISIIGREIRLADILLALNKAKASSAIQDFGCFMLHRFDEDEESIDWHEISPKTLNRVRWNLLNDSLSAQSEDTIEFIYQLIK